MTKTLILEGLGCAHCAAVIEREVSDLPGVTCARVDFITKRLRLETDSPEQWDGIIQKAAVIARQVEKGIEVLEEEAKVSQREQIELDKTKLIRLGIGTLLFMAALLFEFPFWIKLSVYLAAYLLVGGEVLLSAAGNIVKGRVFDENFLMSVATIGAFAIGEYPEGIAVMLFYQIGEFFQELAVNRSRKSIAALMDIRPDYANVMIGQEERRVDPSEVHVGDIILVKPGERVPLDGRVLEGRSMLDTSALTGEAMPKEVSYGSEILSGTVNKNGLLTVEVVREFGQSTVSKILELVENAGSRKARTESFITKFARYYTPAVVLIAVLLAVLPPLLFTGARFEDWIYRALIFLVVSCPCALVISIPLGFFGGIGSASKNGILVKGGNYLEALNNVDTVIFDKTGTLTEGVFEVTQVKSTAGTDATDLLEYAAYAESHSTHPIAQSILKAYGGAINKGEISDLEELPGYGIRAVVRGKRILAGNARLMAQERISFDAPDTVGTVVYIAADGAYLGYIVISDRIRGDSQSAVSALKKQGVRKVVMLTGDSQAVGDRVGNVLGLDAVYGDLLPDGKVNELERLNGMKARKGRLVFVGDGMNDAPVLARADIGIAMGGVGTDAAIEAADVVIMTDEPSKVAAAIKIARRTRTIVWQNIIFAMAVKIVILAMGAGGIATIWEAVFADVGVALLAVLNSIRALKTHIA